MNKNNRDKPNMPNVDKMVFEKQELSEFIESEIMAKEIFKNEDIVDDENEKSNLHGDRANIMLITFLYFSQGIVSGVSAAIPLLLQNYNASYTQQATFSISGWPFSFKLLWAPIVDYLYSERFGRRKSWLIPNQFLIGVFMVVMSYYIDLWLSGDDDGSRNPNVQILTIFFFGLNFVTATQDIALDGWAIQMVKRRNVGYVATSNLCGFKSGYFIGFSIFLGLESTEFCNRYLRSVPQSIGLVTLADVLWYWGLCFLCTTMLIAFLKREQRNEPEDMSSSHSEFSIINSYKILFFILKIPSIKVLIFILVTSKFAYAVCDNVVNLKLLDAGISRDSLLILMTLSAIPTGIILPLIITKYTSGPKPTETYIGFMPFRTLLSIVAVCLVWQAPRMILQSGETSSYLLVFILVQNILYDACTNSMVVSMAAFFAQVSDRRAGATYMTLCNTFENIGSVWPGTISLWMVVVLTWTECDYKNEFQNISNGNFSDNCFNSTDAVNCTTAIVSPTPNPMSSTCKTTIDGFYIEAIICLVYGIVWYFCAKSKIRYLQRLPKKVWFIANENY